MSAPGRLSLGIFSISCSSASPPQSAARQCWQSLLDAEIVPVLFICQGSLTIEFGMARLSPSGREGASAKYRGGGFGMTEPATEMIDTCGLNGQFRRGRLVIGLDPDSQPAETPTMASSAKLGRTGHLGQRSDGVIGVGHGVLRMHGRGHGTRYQVLTGSPPDGVRRGVVVASARMPMGMSASEVAASP